MADNVSSDDERQPQLAQGLTLLHDGRYWEAHEVWEQLWLSHPEPSAARRATKALIQLAAICYKPDQAAADRSEADMQRGMAKLLDTSRHHLATSFELPPPTPRWSRQCLEDTLTILVTICENWRSGQSLDAIRRRIRAVARQFNPPLAPPPNTS